jgi:hypothetical protein
LIFLSNKQFGLGMASASPLFGIGVITTSIAEASPTEWSWRVGWALSWVFFFSVASLGLLRATLATFDRSLGRISPRVRVAQPSPVKAADAVGRPGMSLNA